MDSKPKVLIVDDDEMTAQLIELKLREKGFKTSIAGHGLTALSQVLAEQPGLVILDIMMPGLSGLEVLSLIRREFSSQQIPVIMISWLNLPKVILEADRLGAMEYLIKPFEPIELVSKVEKYFA